MPRLLSYTLFSLFMLLFALPAAGQEVAGRIKMAFDLSHHPRGQEVNLWLPYPVSDDLQTIDTIVVSGNYANAAVYTDNVNRNPMLHAVWPKNAKSRTLTLSFDVSRQAVKRNALPKSEVAWDPADYAHYLAPTRLGPTDGPVGELAAKIVTGKTGVLAKAKAIYDWTVENTYRNPETVGCGDGDVCLLLSDPGGKCADISSIYVALARAAGVPSREVFGIRQGKNAGQDITGWQHCWAEFYLPGHGWVPVDPADVRKMMLKEKLQLEDEKTAAYRDTFWGGLDPYRVRLSEGRDLTLQPAQQGEALNYLMYPYAEVGGNPLNWLDPKTFRYTITYRPR